MTEADPRHYRMPFEGHPHRGTILTWPHRPEVWEGRFDEAERCFVRLASELSGVEELHLNVPDGDWRARVEARLGEAGAELERVVFHLVPSDDVWARDHGPMIVLACEDAPAGTPPVAMVDWVFNAWGGKFEHALDDRVPEAMNADLGLPRFTPGLVMEGGSIEVNGAGDGLTTRAVLLNPNRNPGTAPDALEESLRTYLGIERLHWLDAGLEGDDTDGHVDDLARFVDERSIVAVGLPAEGHPDRAVNAANLERLASFAGADGRPFEIHTLPVPAPVLHAGRHLPASYANFYIANGLVLVPTFEQPADDAALGLLAELFSDRRVVGVDARALVSQSGAIHCVTQPIPRPLGTGASR